MHLFHVFDENFLRYSAMILSMIGILKNNFITETYFEGTPLSMNIDNNVYRTHFIVTQLGQFSKGVLTVSSLLAFIAAFFEGETIANTDVTPYFWHMFAFVFFFYGTMAALMEKTGL
jgi:ABC-type Na+ efflux pump permease subunit